MDSASSCRDKLTYFRIKELKDVLTQLGLAKQGKKQELMDRILALLRDDQVLKPVWARRNIGREVVIKIIDDTYRKMQIPGAIDLASKAQSGSEFSPAKSKEELDSYKQETKVRCPCGKSLISESMIQCEDMQCRVWQHIDCVIIPDKPGDCIPAIPSQFYCETCRINRADPFWVTVKHVLFPVKLPHCGLADDSTTITVQNEERTFQLLRSDNDLLQRHDYSLQVWCLLLNDKVLFRMHWPQYTELQVNGVSIRVLARPGSQLLGINGRDDGPVISTYSMEGVNKIVLSRRDTRVFCFGIRLVKRQTVQQVLSLVPKEADGEHFQEALARVRRCVGGGADTENADSDSDIELVADSVTVNLRCPMTGSRIKIAGRFKPCVHLKGFDLEAFVELSRRSRKWQCPICLKNYALENIIIDPYFNRITSMLQNCGEDVTEVNLKPDGSWCVKGEVEYRDLSKWHLPDGTLSDVDVQAKSDFGNLRHVKQKSPSERAFTLNLGIKLEANGGPEDNGVSSSRSLILRLESHSQNIINMSSSATGSYREGEDQSINQEFEEPFNLSLNNGNEFDSFNILDEPCNIEDRPPAPLDVICLSDSDEDNIALISHEPANGVHADDNDLVPFPTHPKISERYSENPGPETSGTSFLELFNNPDDFEMPMPMPMPVWSLQNGPPPASNFQLFGTEVLDALDDPHATLDCPPFNGYDLTPSNGAETSQIQDFSNLHPSTAMQESFINNPLAFTNDDPSLQIFLPNQPISADLQDDMINQTEAPNGMNSDWISLRLAAGGGHSETAPSNGSISRNPEPPNETQMDVFSDAAPLLLSINHSENNRPPPRTQRPDSSPGQQRAIRRRLYLSIDSDSD